jgi:hypothetical protein
VELRDKHAPKTPIWLAETATLSHGGAENVSDRFVSGFWYLAQLGYLASNGYSGMHREHFRRKWFCTSTDWLRRRGSSTS